MARQARQQIESSYWAFHATGEGLAGPTLPGAFFFWRWMVRLTGASLDLKNLEPLRLELSERAGFRLSDDELTHGAAELLSFVRLLAEIDQRNAERAATAPEAGQDRISTPSDSQTSKSPRSATHKRPAATVPSITSKRAPRKRRTTTRRKR